MSDEEYKQLVLFHVLMRNIDLEQYGKWLTVDHNGAIAAWRKNHSHVTLILPTKRTLFGLVKKEKRILDSIIYSVWTNAQIIQRTS